MEHIKILTSTLNEILAYLGKRPYEEVFQHVTKIQTEAQAFIQSVEAEAKQLLDSPDKSQTPISVIDSVMVPAPDFPPVPERISPQEPIPVPSPLPVPAQ